VENVLREISIGHDARSRQALYAWCGLQRPHMEVHGAPTRIRVVTNRDLTNGLPTSHSVLFSGRTSGAKVLAHRGRLRGSIDTIDKKVGGPVRVGQRCVLLRVAGRSASVVLARYSTL
jgi:hypothetical protein